MFCCIHVHLYCFIQVPEQLMKLDEQGVSILNLSLVFILLEQQSLVNYKPCINAGLKGIFRMFNQVPGAFLYQAYNCQSGNILIFV